MGHLEHVIDIEPVKKVPRFDGIDRGITRLTEIKPRFLKNWKKTPPKSKAVLLRWKSERAYTIKVKGVVPLAVFHFDVV